MILITKFFSYTEFNQVPLLVLLEPEVSSHSLQLKGRPSLVSSCTVVNNEFRWYDDSSRKWNPTSEETPNDTPLCLPGNK